MFGDVLKGVTGTLTTGKGIGTVLAVILVLAVIYGFAPSASPEAIGGKISGGQ